MGDGLGAKGGDPWPLRSLHFVELKIAASMAPDWQMLSRLN